MIMKKSYILTILLFSFFLFATSNYAQESSLNAVSNASIDIPGLSIYPNPVSNGKIYINSSLNTVKQVNIYDVLGKKVLSTSLLGKELGISELKAGVYILRIKQNDYSATRKLVVK